MRYWHWASPSHQRYPSHFSLRSISNQGACSRKFGNNEAIVKLTLQQPELAGITKSPVQYLRLFGTPHNKDSEIQYWLLGDIGAAQYSEQILQWLVAIKLSEGTLPNSVRWPWRVSSARKSIGENPRWATTQVWTRQTLWLSRIIHDKAFPS